MALTSGTYLDLSLTYTFTDLSVLLDKVRSGDVSSVSGYGNNVVDANLDRDSIKPYLDDGSPNPNFEHELANGSAYNTFVRISDVNNYIGNGDLQASDFPGLPNERLISDVLMDQGSVDLPEAGALNNLFMDVGQYIDHGLDLFKQDDSAGTYSIDDGSLTLEPNGTISATRTKSIDSKGTYSNSVSNWLNQSQTYGSESAVTYLLTESLRDAEGNLVYGSDGLLKKTARLLGGSGYFENNRIGNSAEGAAVDFPTGYDVLINNGINKEVLDNYIADHLDESKVVQQWVDNLTAYLQFRADPEAWKQANPKQPDPTSPNPSGSPTKTPGNVASAISTLKAGWAAIEALPGYVNLTELVPGTLNQKLIGDRGFGASMDPVNLLQHYVSGDLRTNENILLTSIQAIFHKSHNAQVDGIYASLAELEAQYGDATSLNTIEPGLRSFFRQDPNTGGISLSVTEGEVFAMARAVVNSMYQRMVYDQYLTALVGGLPFGNPVTQDFSNQPRFFGQLPVGIQEHGLNGFYPEVDASISIEFNTAGFRVGHTQVYEDIDYLELSNGQFSFADLSKGAKVLTDVIGVNGVSLIEAFLKPEMVGALGGPAAILAGNAQAPAQAVDTLLHDVVRNLLVGRPNDLGAFNLMRGREVGMATLQEFLKATSDMLAAGGIANSLGFASSDLSSGLAMFNLDPSTGLPQLGPDGLASQFDELSERLRPYTSWADFGANLRGTNLTVDAKGAVTGVVEGSLLDGFMRLYSQELFADNQLSMLELNGDVGLNRVELWVALLAERPVATPNGAVMVPSLLGRTGTFIIQEQFDRLQDADLHYYKQDLIGSDLFNQVAFQTFTAQISSAFDQDLQAQFIHQDTFRRFQLENPGGGSGRNSSLKTTAQFAVEEILQPGGTLFTGPLFHPQVLKVIVGQLNANPNQPLLELLGAGDVSGKLNAVGPKGTEAQALLAELALEAPQQIDAIEASLRKALPTNSQQTVRSFLQQAARDVERVEQFILGAGAFAKAGPGDVSTLKGLSQDPNPSLLLVAQLAVAGLRFDNQLLIGNDVGLTATEPGGVLEGSQGADDIRAGNGRDLVDGGLGQNNLYGQGGNDFLRPGVNNVVLNFLHGGDHNDVLVGGIAESLLFGNDDNDLLILSEGPLGGFGQGGSGKDILLGGQGGNVMLGDSGVNQASNLGANEYANVLLGSKGGDELIGRGGGDLLMGGGNEPHGNVLGADLGAIIIPTGDTLYGDHESDQNAEILARVLVPKAGGDVDGWIVDETLLSRWFGDTPLRLDIGTSAQISLVNPLTGDLFTAGQRAAVEDFITKTRKVSTGTSSDVLLRGPQVVINWVPFAPSNNDVLISGTYLAHRAIKRTLAEAKTLVNGLNPRAMKQANEALQVWINTQQQDTHTVAPSKRIGEELAFGVNGQIVEAPLFDGEGEKIEGPFFDANGNPTLIAGQPLFTSDPTELDEDFVATPVTVELRRPLPDQIYAGGGSDTILTDAHNDLLIFGGLGYDTIDYRLMDRVMNGVSLRIDIDPQTADGVVVHSNTALDRFYSIEQLIFGGKANLSISSGARLDDPTLIGLVNGSETNPNSGNALQATISGDTISVNNLSMQGIRKLTLSLAENDRAVFNAPTDTGPSSIVVTFGSNGAVTVKNAVTTTTYVETEFFQFSKGASTQILFEVPAGYVGTHDTETHSFTLQTITGTTGAADDYLNLTGTAFVIDQSIDIVSRQIDSISG